MPYDLAGKYIWLTAFHEAYLCLEGEIRTALTSEDILGALDSSLAQLSTTSGDQTVYRVPDAKVFNIFIVRQDLRCALIAREPVIFSGAVGDGLATIADEVRQSTRKITVAANGRAELVFERLLGQAAIPY